MVWHIDNGTCELLTSWKLFFYRWSVVILQVHSNTPPKSHVTWIQLSGMSFVL